MCRAVLDWNWSPWDDSMHPPAQYRLARPVGDKIKSCNPYDVANSGIVLRLAPLTETARARGEDAAAQGEQAWCTWVDDPDPRSEVEEEEPPEVGDYDLSCFEKYETWMGALARQA